MNYLIILLKPVLIPALVMIQNDPTLLLFFQYDGLKRYLLHLFCWTFVCWVFHLFFYSPLICQWTFRWHLLKFTKLQKILKDLGSVRHNSVLKPVGQKESLISIDPLNGELGINSESYINPCRKKKKREKNIFCIRMSIGEFLLH